MGKTAWWLLGLKDNPDGHLVKRKTAMPAPYADTA